MQENTIEAFTREVTVNKEEGARNYEQQRQESAELRTLNEKQIVENQELKERMSMLENKNSEAGFKKQFELYQLRLKAEEEERKQEIIRKQKEEERK